MNLASLIEARLDRFGDTRCLLSEGRWWTTSELRDASRRLASGLIRLGLGPGDRVLIQLPNRAEVLVSYMGVWALGGAAVPILPELTDHEVLARVRDCQPRAIIATGGRLAGLRSELDELGVTTRVAIEDASVADAVRFEELTATGEVAEPAAVVADALAMVLYTGGTTRDPKGVMITHASLKAGIDSHAVREAERVSLMAVPMSHIAGVWWCLSYFQLGDHIAVLSRFDPGRVFSLIEAERVEVMCGAPTMYATLLAHPRAGEADTSSMSRWTYASAPMPPYQIEAFEAEFGGILHAAYGLTESSGGLFSTEGAGQPRKPASVGRIQPGSSAAMRLVDDDGYDVSPGEVGEVWLSGDSITPGYLGKPEATEELLRGEWLCTGDLGWIDDDGDLFLVGRKKQIIISGGFNVYPAEIEEVVCRLPLVQSCAVLGLENELLGEEIVACVVPRTAELTSDQVRAHCRELLADYKIPRIKFIEAMPVTGYGKPDKRELARRLTSREAPATGAASAATPSRGRVEALTQLVRERVAALVGVAAGELDEDQPLMELGLSSAGAVRLSGDLADAVERELPATLAFDHPSIAKIGNFLAGGEGAAPGSLRRGRAESDPERLREALAMVGAACYLPGGLRDPESFWQFLRDGGDATGPVPADRWDIEEGRDPATRFGAFVPDIAGFDAAFFGISPAEAAAMDPQQRWLLELTWEAFERAGIAPSSLEGSRTAVYVGMSFNEYLYLADFRRSVGSFGGGTGGFPSVASGRLAHYFGLRGPALTVDTACSSSLVALHYACQSLRAGDCDMAVVAGVNAMVTPKFHAALAAAGALSPDGRCKTFDESANGYVRGEGAVVVVLKRLSDAIEGGHEPLAVIRGTAVNHDGRSSSLTAPNSAAQEALLRDALADADADPEGISYVEMHGTGTPLGDPIEVGALARVFGGRRRAPLSLGSVKAHIGHLEPAAGLAGLLRAALCLRHGEITPQRNVQRINAHVDLQAIPAAVHTVRTPMSRRGEAALAGVSSFGFSGTNAHAILEEPPRCETSASPGGRGAHLLCLSATTEAGIAAAARRYADHLASRPSVSFADLCYTASAGRDHFSHRLALVASNGDAAQERLRAYAEGEVREEVWQGGAAPGARVCMLFSGQGAQYAGMAKSLYARLPVFRDVVDRLAAAMDSELERPLVELVCGLEDEPDRIHRTACTQPALFAVELGLAEVWRSWGVQCDAVLGHSVGEFAAACVAGMADPEEVGRLVALRGRLMQGVRRAGRMAVAFAPAARVEKVLDRCAGQVVVAATNGPRNTVIAGEAAGVEEAVARLREAAIDTESLRVSQAFHSPLMEDIVAEFEEGARAIDWRPSTHWFGANVSGDAKPPGWRPDAAYWASQLRSPVRFAESLQHVADRCGGHVFLEAGPHPVLVGMGPQVVADEGVRWVGTLRRGLDAWRALLGAAARLYCAGVDLSWEAVYANEEVRKVVAPTYPFDRRPHWIEEVRPLEGVAARRPACSPHDHPLLGRRIDSPLRPVQFESDLDDARVEFLRDHVVFGDVIVPATGYLEMAQAALTRANAPGPVLTHVSFERALALADGVETRLQTIVTRAADEVSFEIYSHSTARDAWTLHCRGTRGDAAEDAAQPPLDRGPEDTRWDEVSVASYYERRARHGMVWGPRFQGVEQMWKGPPDSGEALGLIRMPAGLGGPEWQLHPAFLDACLQPVNVAMATLSRDGVDADQTYLPVGIERVRLHGELGDRVRSWVRFRPAGRLSELVSVDLDIFDDAGRLLLELRGLSAQRVSETSLARLTRRRPPAHLEVVWREIESTPGAPRAGGAERWVVVSDDADAARALRDEARARGIDCRVVLPPREGGDAWLDAVVAEDDAPDAAPTTVVAQFEAHSLDDLAPSDAVGDAHVRCAGRVLALAQHLLKRVSEGSPPPRLAVTTRGAQAIAPSDRPEPTLAALWGLGRVIRLEHPELHCVQLDLPADRSDSASPGALVEPLAAHHSEQELGLRGDAWLATRLERLRARDSGPLFVRERGAYLITGGYGAIGRRVAGWLLERGAGRVVLVGRREVRLEDSPELRQLEPTGARVVTASADVSRDDELESLLQTIEADLPIRGIVHAAGVVEDGLVRSQSWGAYERVMGPKVRGAWALGRCARERAVDFFVMFSSATSVLGNAGQGAYAVANAFMDGLAHRLRADGVRALAVNWGPWDEEGMATRAAGSAPTASRGLAPIPADDALESLESLLCGSVSQAVVLPNDLEPLVRDESSPMVSSLRAELDVGRDVSRAEDAAGGAWSLAARARNEDPLSLARAYLDRSLRGILGLEEEEEIDPDESVFELGMDSLLAVEFRNRIARDLDRSLQPTLVYDFPTLRELAERVAALLSQRGDSE